MPGSDEIFPSKRVRVMAEPKSRVEIQDTWNALRQVSSAREYACGELLFGEGDPPEGVLILESGTVRLSTAFACQERVLAVVSPGGLLGLSETITNKKYKVSAHADNAVTVSFVPKADFLGFAREHVEFCMQVVEMLSRDLHGLYSTFVALQRSSAHTKVPI